MHRIDSTYCRKLHQGDPDRIDILVCIGERDSVRSSEKSRREPSLNRSRLRTQRDRQEKADQSAE
jgi:hypothetical protein